MYAKIPFPLVLRSVLLLAITVPTAVGQVTVFPTRAAYNLANPVNTTVTFESLGSGTMYPGGLTLSGATFAGINGATAESLDGSVVGVAGTVVLFANNGLFNTDSLQVTLPTNTFACGTDFKSDGSFSTEPYSFTLFSGGTSLGTFPTTATSPNSFSFIGFSSPAAPITSVRIQVTGAIGTPEPLIDNFTFVPEPSAAMLLLALGACCLRCGNASATDLKSPARRFLFSAKQHQTVTTAAWRTLGQKDF